MFEKQLAALIAQSRMIAQRSEGVAFFRLARDLYRLEEISYLCVNLPLPVKPKCYTHCFYSDTGVKQFASTNLITLDFLGHADDDDFANEPSSTLVVRLSHRAGETAFFGISAPRSGDWE